MRFGVILALAAVGTLSGDTYPRQPAVDAVHYRFALTLPETLDRIDAEATVTFRVVTPVKHIELDLVSSAGGKGVTVAGVSLGGGSVQFAHEADRLRVSVPDGTTAGQELTYSIIYGGTPAEGLRKVTTMHGEPAVFSDNWPNRARHWLPMIDHPYDKATGEVIVTAPAQYQVVSNGLLIDERDVHNRQRRTHWKQSVPIASWLYALAVASFDVHHAGTVQGVPLQTWVYPHDRVKGRALFEETSRRAIDFFSQRVGNYPYEKLANVQAAFNWGGLENATVIFYGEKGVASGASPVVHEIAHQWFGNSVTQRDWNDVWLSEGFATYFADLYTEHFIGRDVFVQDLRRSREAIIELETKLPDTPVVHRNLSNMEGVLNQLVYAKGGWVLHMLRGEIGTDHFWEGIREYYRRYRNQNASTDDLRQVMEQVSGRDLKWFFAQWLSRPGVPRVEGRWRYDATQRALEVRLSQTQAGPTFRLTVEVGQRDTAGIPGATERLLLDSREKVFAIPVGAAPSVISLDPGTWMLADLAALEHRQ